MKQEKYLRMYIVLSNYKHVSERHESTFGPAVFSLAFNAVRKLYTPGNVISILLRYNNIVCQKNNNNLRTETLE